MKARISEILLWTLVAITVAMWIVNRFYPPLRTSLPGLDEQKPSLEVVAR